MTDAEKVKILAKALESVVTPTVYGETLYYIGPSASDCDLTKEVAEAMKIVEELRNI